MSDLPQVISGTRRQIRELVDGSLEVRIHIDPRFKADFHRLFPSIDMPCAIAPLIPDFERKEPPKEETKGGALSRLAGMWCKDEDFQQWLYENYFDETEPAVNEETAADWIRVMCNVASRSEIDRNEKAADHFQKYIRSPFMDWMNNR